MFKNKEKRAVYAWALNDWANSAYATTIIAGFFPIFFKKFWCSGMEAGESTFRLGIANSSATVIVALISPVLGAIADRGGAKKKFLFFFTYLGIIMTLSLFMVAQGQWLTAMVLYVAGTVGFNGSLTYYDSLLVLITKSEKRDYVSSLGYSLGYLGGGLLFALNVAMTLKPGFFGFADSSEAVRVSFVTVGIWWAAFSIPVFLFVKEPPIEKKESYLKIITGGFSSLLTTLKEIKKFRQILIFLFAYWFYIDGVDTIINMSVDYGMSIGFDSNNLIVALLITQFVGFPSAIVTGKLGERIGTKSTLFICIIVYICVCVWGSLMNRVSEFYILAVTVGLVQGGIQSLSRSLFSRIIPQTNASQFFGFYNMLGKFAMVIGPVLMGSVSLFTKNPRFSVLSVIILFVAGGIILYFLDEEEGKKAIRMQV
ncbi:MAG: MFS transporter [Spirochaetes bacterium]|nr:MFS transporter [Spirochaetota bacterium]